MVIWRKNHKMDVCLTSWVPLSIKNLYLVISNKESWINWNCPEIKEEKLRGLKNQMHPLTFTAIEQEPMTRIQLALVTLNSFSSSWTLVNSNVLLVHVYLQITSSLPPSYAANLPHLIGISRTDIPLSPTSARYFDEGLNSIESTSNRGTSVQAKVCI